MYCSKCGKEIANNSKFCPECGKVILSTESKNLKECSLCGKEEGTDSKCAKCISINGDIKQSDNKDNNFTIFSIKGAVIVVVVLAVVVISAVLSFSESTPSESTPNCQELSDAIVGKKAENLGREGKILKSELKEVLSEEPNNLVCVVGVLTTIGDYDLILEFDGEFTKWEVYINPTNCQELSDAMVGNKVGNLLGREGKILKSELKEVLSEEPNNLVCVLDVVTTIGDYELMSEYDGEFLRWGSNE